MRDFKRESAKFLMHIFDQDMVVCATIATAEAEGNTQVLLDALKTVNEYVNELKTGLKKDGREISKMDNAERNNR